MTGCLRTAKLADIAELNPALTEALGDDDQVSFIPMSAVDADAASTLDKESRRYSEVSKGYTPFLDGDVLVAKITPCFENGKIAQARLARRVGFGSTEFHIVRPHVNQADARYLLHFLRQERIRREGERKMTGSAGQRRIPEHFLVGLRVPLPPFPSNGVLRRYWTRRRRCGPSAAPYEESSPGLRAFPPGSRAALLTEAVAEVRDERHPLRLRAKPRVLKRAVLGYLPKRQKHHHWPQPARQPVDAVLVVK